MDMLEELDDLGLPNELPPERNPHMQRYRIDPENCMGAEA